MKEIDLHPALFAFLTNLGYEVRSEVHHCDMTARKEDALIIIELKRDFNLTLLLQATSRQKLTDLVYVAVPKPSGRINRERWKGIHHILRRLEIGLLYVDFSFEPANVEIIYHPTPYQRRRSPAKRTALLKEIAARSGDFNVAGSSSRKIMTAYRECALLIAYRLLQMGSASPRTLRESGTCPKTQSILVHNYYNWFDHVERGLYRLTQTGEEAVAEHEIILDDIIQKSSVKKDITT